MREISRIKIKLLILIACEESQSVTIELRKLGHEAYSCDTEDCSGGHSEWHIKDDVLNHLEGWDMIIAFPPCTHLAVSGARHFAKKIADGRQKQGIDLFIALVNAPCSLICIENPIGIMSSIYRKPDQIIQPYQFGDPEKKSTCLWLKNLPLLKHTDVVIPETKLYKNKKSKSGFSSWGKITGCNPSTNSQHNARLRSKTYPGIAKAMAEQWSDYLCSQKRADL